MLRALVRLCSERFLCVWCFVVSFGFAIKFCVQTILYYPEGNPGHL